jgi:glyoxylase-like metal-dependent hydrolase (beta-lactamase superfamily II)
MAHKIKIITLPMPVRMGMVNAYLIDAPGGHLLIDTGNSSARKELCSELENCGCSSRSFKLVILTHGDFDHIGNAAYLRKTYGVRIAMHTDDLGMAERGDMFANRNKPNIIFKLLMPIFSGFGRDQRFTPDIPVGDGYEFSEYGFDARVVSLPGHSKGSIGILTGEGELFCGDLFENIKGPTLNSLMDDPAAAKDSIEKLDAMQITMVYPGHGQPFTMESLKNNKAKAA